MTQLRRFHITIGAAPATGVYRVGTKRPAPSLENEVRLVKAALLYADHVTLCSFSTTMLTYVVSLATLTTREKIDLLRSLLPILATDTVDAQTLDKWDRVIQMLDQKASLTVEEQAMLTRFEDTIEVKWEQVIDRMGTLLQGTGLDEITTAVESGLLKLHVLGSKTPRGKPIVNLHNLPKRTSSEWDDRIFIEFLDLIAKAISDSKTYPLFDDLTGQLIRHAIQEERLVVSDTGVARGKHTLLSSHLLERLPLFDAATMDEVLDIRRELDAALIRFRQAIIGFSDKMKHAAWDKDFPAEADHLFHKDIAPAILAIEEHVKSSRSLTHILERIAKKPLASGGVLSVLLSPIAAVPELASLALIGGGATSAALTTALEMREIIKERRGIEQNQLYFYYRAQKLLEK